MPKGTRPQGAEARFQQRLTTERGRAKTLLRKVEKELEGVPQMSSAKGVDMGGDSLRRGLSDLGVVINDGIRKLQGKDTSREMKGKIRSLRRYLAETRRLKDSLPPGKDSLTSPRDSGDVPRLPKFKKD